MGANRKQEKKAFLLAVACSLIMLYGSGGVSGKPLEEQNRARSGIDLILIVDTSASMRGQGSGQDIFAEVQKATKDLISELSFGDTVTLIPFDSRALVHPTVTLYSETERQRLFAVVDQLVADGKYTYTAEALRAGLSEAGRLDELLPHHAKVVVILTDGINDPPPDAKGRAPTLLEVAQPYLGRPWFVYQVQLGRFVDRDLEAAIRPFRGGVIHDPRGARLRELAERVLPKPPKVIHWSSDPRELAVELRAANEPKEVRFRLLGAEDLPVSAVVARLKWEVEPWGASCHVRDLDAQEATLGFTCVAPARIPDGVYRGTLVLTLNDDVSGFFAEPLSLPVTLRAAMGPPRWPYLVGAIGVFVAAVALYRARARRKLFGRLEYWRRSASMEKNNFWDLSDFGTEAVLGSRQMKLPGVHEPLAVFRIRVVDGVRHVVVAANPNQELAFGDRRELELVLFDGDEFEIGDWHFRYRGEVPRRRP